MPTAHVVDLGDFSDHPLVGEFSESFSVTGASRVSGDLARATASVRRTAMMLAAFDVADPRVEPTVVVVDGSVPELVSDACSFSALVQVSAAETSLAQRVKAMCDALAGGDIEWIVVTPPERAAVESVTVQVAQGCALGLRVAGVLVAPMPRKRDGWPKKIRRSARRTGGTVARALVRHSGAAGVEQARFRCSHPTRHVGSRPPVPGRYPRRSRRKLDLHRDPHPNPTAGTSCRSLSRACSTAMSRSECGHKTRRTRRRTSLFASDGVVARIELNSTLRRCVAVEAVVAGDSIAVSFRADPAQWPDPRASRGASDQTGESGKEA